MAGSSREEKNRKEVSKLQSALLILHASPLQQRQLQNTLWKAVTKFSHIGFVSVLKPKKKKLFVCFIYCAAVLEAKAGWACIYLRELSMKN